MKPLQFETRVTLYAPDPLPALRMLDRPGIAVCDVVREAKTLPGQVRDMQPHAVYLAVPPPDVQGMLREIAALCPARPPRIAAAFAADFEVDDLTALDACALLARPSLPARTACAEKILSGLGMADSLKGFSMLARGAALLSAVPLPLPPLQYGLYPQLARENGVSADVVERRMRSAIESAWLHGDLAAQNALMGLSVSAERGKPTNSELLCRLAERICHLLYTDCRRTQ